MDEETWDEIDEHLAYAVSNCGRVMDLDRERQVPVRQNAQGFSMVTIRDLSFQQRTRSVAMLVAQTFLPAPRNEAYNSVIHLNGDRMDCRASNLMWRPRWFAIRYHKMFDDLPTRVSVWIPATGETFASLRELCTTYGLIEDYTYTDMNNRMGVFHYGFLIERYRE